MPYDANKPFAEASQRWPPNFVSDQLFGQMEWYDRLNTDTARQIAQDRLALMTEFVAQAQREILAGGE